MADFHEGGDCIEGKKVRIDTRKHLLQTSIRHAELGQLYKYKCSIRSESEIKEELNPKVAQFNANSHLDIFDCLKANVIEIYSSRLLNFGVAANVTSTHSSQTCEARCYTYAEIFIPFDHILNKKPILPEDN